MFALPLNRCHGNALRDPTQREKVLELGRYRHEILPWRTRISQNGAGTVTTEVSTTGDVLNGVIVCIKEIVYSHGELHGFQRRDVWIQSSRFYPKDEVGDIVSRLLLVRWRVGPVVE